MIRSIHPVVTIVSVAVVSWLILVGCLRIVYRRFVAPHSDETIVTGRIIWTSHIVSIGWLLGGLAFTVYGVFTVPNGALHDTAFVLSVALAGSLLMSANTIALSATDLLEYAELETPRDAIGSIVLSGVGWYGGMAFIATTIFTVPLTTVGLVTIGIPAYYACAPWLTERLSETETAPPGLERRWQRLAADAGFDDIRFRLVTDTSSSNGAATGIVPGYRTVYLTEETTRELSADELDALVAHELGHVHERHLEKRALISSALWGGVTLGLVGLVTNYSGDLFLLFMAAGIGLLLYGKYVVRLEFEADAVAADLTSPKAVTKMLERLTELGHLPRETSGTFEVFTEHPSTSRRVSRLEDA